MSKAGGYVPFNAKVPTQLVDWRSESGSPEVITITLLPILGWQDPPDARGLQFPELPGLMLSLAPMRAIITWAHGGDVSNAATIDYPWRGGTVTVTASTVAVQVIPDQLAGFPPVTFETMRAGAFVSRGSSRQQDLTPPTFTEEIFLTFPAPGVPIPLPKYARAYWVEDNALTNLGLARLWTVTWENRGPPGPDPGVLSNVLRVDQQWVNADQSRTAPAPGKPLPIPSRATHVNVVLGSFGGPVTRKAIVYVMDLGA